MGPSEATACVDPLLLEQELDEKEILLRRAFVQEYMKDRNPYAACLRLGFMAPYAEDWAKAFMSEGIVRRLIAQAEEFEDSPEARAARARSIEAKLFREADYYGPGSSHGARVSALANLARIYGIESPAKTESEVTYKGGVMMVPALTSPDEWGALAAKSQAELKRNVKD